MLVTIADFRTAKRAIDDDSAIALALSRAEQELEYLAGPHGTKLRCVYQLPIPQMRLALPRRPDPARLSDIAVTMNGAALPNTFLERWKYLRYGNSFYALPFWGEVVVTYYAIDDSDNRKAVVMDLAESELASKIYMQEGFDGATRVYTGNRQRQAIILARLDSVRISLGPAQIFAETDGGTTPATAYATYQILTANGNTPGAFTLGAFANANSANITVNLPAYTGTPYVAIVMPQADSLAGFVLDGVGQLDSFAESVSGGNRWYISRYQWVTALSGASVDLTFA